MNLKKSSNLLSMVFMLLTNGVRAQNDTVFVTDSGIRVDRAHAHFYRVSTQTNDTLIQIKEYFLNDTLHFTGAFSNEQGNIKNGQFNYYNERGFKTAEGGYLKGFKHGLWIYYADDGKMIKQKEWYQYPQKEFYQYQYHQRTGFLVREGQIDQFGKKTGYWKEFHDHSDTVKLVHHYESGIRQGEQLEYFANGKLKRREYFEGFRLLQSAQYDPDGHKVKYFPAFEFPKPPEPLKKYLSLRIKCFDEALKHHDIEYKIKIDADGTVSDIEILNMNDGECKSKIIQAILNMKKWRAARRENIPCSFLIESVIKFHAYHE